MRKSAEVELEPTHYHDWLLQYLVSFVVFADAPSRLEDIFTGAPANVKAKWNAVVAAADAYKFAEHGNPPPTGATFMNWPNSRYQFPPNGNNSNTFAESIVTTAGIPWHPLPGLHPGNAAPVPVVGVWAKKQDLTLGTF